MDKIKQALLDLNHGKFVLIYDNDKREGETDLIMPSQFATPQAIRRMRKDGGGLIFLMTSSAIAYRLQLPFLADLFSEINTTYPVLKHLTPNDIPYDTKSSFSLYINHRKTFTGITDNDRSLTMRKFAALITKTAEMDQASAMKAFGEEFRSPGHIPICVAHEHLLQSRKGHTELVVALLELAGLTPVGSGCEMMADDGKALSKEQAERYGKKHHFVFLEGKDIVKAWQS